MKKFNWKTKRFIGGLLTVILLGYGVANPAIVSQVGAEAICSAVACDA
jgi:hypothetical protein